MLRFHCDCGQEVFFESTHCLSCGATLGYEPEVLQVRSLELVDAQWRLSGLDDGNRYHLCKNSGAQPKACNWLVNVTDGQDTCRSCRLTNQFPDLSEPSDQRNWSRAESAKRRLIHGLRCLRLPLRSREEAPDNGLSFALLASHPKKAKEDANDDKEPVITGHQNGLITIDVTEANELHRTKVRLQMQERYRTLLGHFRHETGHYYHWLLVPPDSQWESPFISLFGDPSQDYSKALSAYYENGPAENWQARFVSAYASAHPMEDWAECFSHYLHVDDALETAVSYALIDPLPVASEPGAYELRLKTFLELNVAHNALSRSLGLPDAYPFVLNPRVQAKLRLVHEIVSSASQTSN